MKMKTSGRSIVLRLGVLIIGLSVAAGISGGLMGYTSAGVEPEGFPLFHRPRPILPSAAREMSERTVPVIKRPRHLVRIRLFSTLSFREMSVEADPGLQ